VKRKHPFQIMRENYKRLCKPKVRTRDEYKFTLGPLAKRGGWDSLDAACMDA
jgi:hypothetical protein